MPIEILKYINFVDRCLDENPGSIDICRKMCNTLHVKGYDILKRERIIMDSMFGLALQEESIMNFINTRVQRIINKIKPEEEHYFRSPIPSEFYIYHKDILSDKELDILLLNKFPQIYSSMACERCIREFCENSEINLLVSKTYSTWKRINYDHDMGKVEHLFKRHIAENVKIIYEAKRKIFNYLTGNAGKITYKQFVEKCLHKSIKVT